MSTNELRQKASIESKGSSSDVILESIVSEIKKLDLSGVKSILDIGCGQGALLKKLKPLFPNAGLTGCDYTDFAGLNSDEISFFTHDCNHGLKEGTGPFDLIVSSEVIEHLENGRHFLRETTRVLNPGGILILSTPNPESITSLLSYALRGYHSAFGPKDYPAHILAYSIYDLENIIKETPGLALRQVKFIKNGRIPHSNVHWQTIFPFLKGKRFSDNYMVTAVKTTN